MDFSVLADRDCNGWMRHLVQMAADIFCAGFIVTLCERLRSTSKRSYGRAGRRTGIRLLLRYCLLMTSSWSTLSSRERRRPELRKTWRCIACRTGIAPRHGVVGREAS